LHLSSGVSPINYMNARGKTVSHRNMPNEFSTFAKHHDLKALVILMTVPGIGEILALTILYEIHTIKRFPSAQKFSS